MSQPVSARELSKAGAYVTLHLTVLLWGLTAILGRLISIEAVSLVWYRLVLVIAAMALYMRGTRASFRAAPGLLRWYALAGALIGLHWLCFYGAIKVAGVATAVIGLSTVTFFTAILEPLVFRRPVARHELALGALVMVGASLLAKLEVRASAAGIALALGSAVLAAAFGSLNGSLARKDRAEPMMLYEMLAAAAVTSLVVLARGSSFAAPGSLAPLDVLWLLVLAVVCTVVPQLLVLRILRVLSPFTVSLSVTLEPVYSLIIVVAFFPSAETPSWRFLTGAALLLALVALNAYLKRGPLVPVAHGPARRGIEGP